MRKAIVLVTIFLFASVAYAAGFIGVSLAPDWHWTEEGGNTDFIFTADGANYFGEEQGFGLEYGLGVVFPLNKWTENGLVTLSDPYGFVFHAGAGYRYDSGGIFGISAGIGAYGKLRMFENTPTQDYSTRVFSIDIYGRIAADFSLFDIFSINVGVMAGWPAYTSASIIASGVQRPGEIAEGIFFIVPFIGAAFEY